jgi:hypothetical protein
MERLKRRLFGADGVIGHESDMYRALIDLGTNASRHLTGSPPPEAREPLTASVPIS